MNKDRRQGINRIVHQLKRELWYLNMVCVNERDDIQHSAEDADEHAAAAFKSAYDALESAIKHLQEAEPGAPKENSVVEAHNMKEFLSRMRPHQAATLSVTAEASILGSTAAADPVTEPEPSLTYCTVRDGGDDWHIECSFADGQKFAAVQVDIEFPQLAHRIANFLNSIGKDNERDVYDIQISDSDGETGIGVQGEFANDATAIKWAYYYLGKYRGDRARIWRGDTNPRDPSTLVTEISSAEDARRLCL
jgi:hypothetical protein